MTPTFRIVLTIVTLLCGGAHLNGAALNRIQLPLPAPLVFASGDIFLSMENGDVEWRRPDGTLNRHLMASQTGTGEGMGFDPAGTLYVARWCLGDNDQCHGGNLIEKFSTLGISEGKFGPEYDCAPHTIVFESAAIAYVGLAGCTREILKLEGGETVASFAVASDNYGPFWIDLAADRCTIFYTSWGPNVKRFDVCANAQLPDFNVAPLPAGTGGGAQALRILPDGGVLVASGEVVARLNGAGVLVQTYASSGEPIWFTGLDLVGDGTFWAANYEASTVHRFDIDSGAWLASFSTGTPPHSIVGLAVGR